MCWAVGGWAQGISATESAFGRQATKAESRREKQRDITCFEADGRHIGTLGRIGGVNLLGMWLVCVCVGGRECMLRQGPYSY